MQAVIAATKHQSGADESVDISLTNANNQVVAVAATVDAFLWNIVFCG